MLITGIAIKLYDGGPVFSGQKRMYDRGEKYLKFVNSEV